MRRAIPLSVMAISVFLIGCSGPGPEVKQAQKADNAVAGREETKMLRAADFAGYDGQAVRRTVDKVLDMNDQRQQELEKVLK